MQSTFCSWQTLFPRSMPLCFSSRGTMPLEELSFLLTKPVQILHKQDSAQTLSVDLAFANCIINHHAHEMPTDSEALGTTHPLPWSQLWKSNIYSGVTVTMVGSFAFTSSVMNMGRALFVLTARDFSAIRTTQLAVLLICHLLMA